MDWPMDTATWAAINANARPPKGKPSVERPCSLHIGARHTAVPVRRKGQRQSTPPTPVQAHGWPTHL